MYLLNVKIRDFVMDENRKSGLIVAYYLSRFNEKAYAELGYGNKSQTHTKIAEILNVSPNTVKNWRDEFDVLFSERKGWHQRSMAPSRIQAKELIEDFDEVAIHDIVKDILTNKISYSQISELVQLSESLMVHAKKDNSTRGITGKAAEEYFMNNFSQIAGLPQGRVVDKTACGCGYDFEIIGDETYYIEVKGLSDINGGVLFTNKEWETASDKGGHYILCFICNLKDKVSVKVLHNPYVKLHPKKNTITLVQTTWTVDQKDIFQ